MAQRLKWIPLLQLGRSFLIHLSGDEVVDRTARERFIQMYKESNMLDKENDTRAILVVGDNDWPFPVPIVKKNNGWVFETKEGKEEILNRRIGRNELDVIDVCEAYVDAQHEYASRDWDHSGILEYAQKFRSDKGKWNGLYWKAAEDEVKSPMDLS
jgi:hypothetical protein